MYVDGMLIAESSLVEINKVKQQLEKYFETEDLGVAKKILGMMIMRDRDNVISLSQVEYVKKVLAHSVWVVPSLWAPLYPCI